MGPGAFPGTLRAERLRFPLERSRRGHQTRARAGGEARICGGDADGAATGHQGDGAGRIRGCVSTRVLDLSTRARVYDPKLRKLRPLNPMPPELASPGMDTAFLGAPVEDDVAVEVAEGRLDPISRQPFVVPPSPQKQRDGTRGTPRAARRETPCSPLSVRARPAAFANLFSAPSKKDGRRRDGSPRFDEGELPRRRRRRGDDGTDGERERGIGANGR